MKKLTLLFTLLAAWAFIATPTYAQNEKQLSIWERIFGTSERPSENKSEKSEEKDDDDDEKQEKEAKVNKEKAKKESANFSNEEREVLENWQQGNASWKKSKKRLPPGLQKKVARGGELPPGWKKKLEVGSVLDPELEKEAKPLPQEILERLPKTPDGTEIITIGEEVVRVFENSREIIDILSGNERREESDRQRQRADDDDDNYERTGSRTRDSSDDDDD